MTLSAGSCRRAMGLTLVFYIGRVLQVMGIVTVASALIVFGGADGRMGDMLKLAFAGVAEFYIGYAITAMAGRRQ